MIVLLISSFGHYYNTRMSEFPLSKEENEQMIVWKASESELPE